MGDVRAPGGHLRQDLERLARLRPIDDDFMRCVFRGNLPLAQEVLRTITGIADLVLLEEETQHDLRRLAGARSVELDVWGRDSAGRLYDLEVQRGDAPWPRRARYHCSAMDVEALRAGDEFERLPESYVIFIMEEDPFGLGLGTYPVGRVVEATGEPFGDGSHVLYANGSYRGDDELGTLMRDLCESDPGRMSGRLLAERARYLKSDPEGVRQMCEIMEEIRAEGLREGLEQGLEQGLAGAVRGVMSSLGVDARRAMDIVGVAAPERGRLLELLG